MVRLRMRIQPPQSICFDRVGMTLGPAFVESAAASTLPRCLASYTPFYRFVDKSSVAAALSARRVQHAWVGTFRLGVTRPCRPASVYAMSALSDLLKAANANGGSARSI